MARTTFSLGLGFATWPLRKAAAEVQLLVPQQGTGNTDVTPEELFRVRPIYMHNIVPTNTGVQSVGYVQEVAPITPAASDFDFAYVILDSGDNVVIHSPAKGKNYLYLESVGAWQSVTPITYTRTDLPVTWTRVQSRTFVCYPYHGIYEYNSALGVFAQLVLTGVSAAAIRGISSSANFLLLYTADTIYRSSLVDLTDFTPSLVTGAGSESVTDLQGPITAILPLGQDVVIYSARNAVGAKFTDNMRFPFTYKVVRNCGGVTSPQHVAYSAHAGKQFAYTSVGLQEIELQGATLLFPAMTDFIIAGIKDAWDAGTQTLATSTLPITFAVKLTFFDYRYLVVSYGEFSYTNAFIYDVGLKRWGHLRLDHVDCFSYIRPNTFSALTYDELVRDYGEEIRAYSALTDAVADPAFKPQQDIAFLQADGTIYRYSLEASEASQDAVLLLGAFTVIRGHDVLLTDVELQLTGNRVYDLIAIANFDTSAEYREALIISASTDYVDSYSCNAAGAAVTLLLTGQFNLKLVEITVSPLGWSL